ncbi:TPA: WxL domain-containing protein, partial [Enterococcus faecalis]|nr:WxL domain-containing protein [Enterococcus faecalis]
MINAFSGVTAVAENITIESSPTVASSAKEATSASSATPESTESSQETTETSREEVTQEIEKQAEIPEVKTETTESVPENSSENDRQKRISPRWVPNNQVIYPRMIFGFTDETGKAFADENLTLSGTYTKFLINATTRLFQATAYRYPIVSSNAGGGQYRVAVNAAVPLPYDFYTNLPAGYNQIFYAIEQLKIDNTLKYVDNIIVIPNSTMRAAIYSSQHTSETPKFGNFNIPYNPFRTRESVFSKSSGNIFSLNSDNKDLLRILFVGRINNPSEPVLFGFDGTSTYRETVNYVVTRKQVTEKFVDTNGVAITPPTGFTQNKKTPMTSNAFTFKQSGTLPDTYQADGKTYKFKGWYKGKTKPNTLTTTKAPSYAVTYDDNDDLNVVYEEIEAFDFPAVNYQFGFVGEDGKLANPADINITYDYTGIEVRGNGGADSNVSFKTIASNQSGTTVGNFKQVIFPASSIERPTTTGWNGDGFSEFSIKLPKYYESVNLYDKTGKINTNYPLPRVTLVESNVPDTIFSESTLISDLALTQKADKSYTLREVNVSMNPNIKYPNLISRNINSLDERDGNIRYKTIEGPIYYHLTNRRVTENFVDANGTKITPPTGFTQGKQTVINSDPYTFKQSGTLPDTYQADGKTYKFKGWYKGKTKPNTLTTTKAPSYPVTYNDDDDLTVVYEEETVTPVYPSMNVNFVDEKGVGFTPALTFSGKYRVQRTSDMLYTDLYDLMTKNNGNGQYTFSLNNGSMPLSPELFNAYANSIKIDGLNKLIFDFNQISIANQLKYVDNIELDTIKSKLNLTRYTYTSTASTVFDINQIPVESSGNSDNILSFANNNGFFTQNASALLYMDVGVVSNSIRMFGFNAKNAINSTAVYTVTRKQVTENFVNTSGAKITPPTGFTQGNQIPMTSNTFKYTAARALPASYTTGGKTYIFQGWYKGKTKPNTLTTSTTPTYNTTFDGNDDMTAMYKEEVPKASVALTRITAETVTSGGNVTWRATITNTSQAPLTTATIKKSTAWTTGLAAPTAMIVTPAGGTAKTVPVTATTWTNGVSLGTDIPAGKSATVQFTTKATGTAGQVLRAGITTSGNYSGVSTSATVRVKDND